MPRTRGLEGRTEKSSVAHASEFVRTEKQRGREREKLIDLGEFSEHTVLPLEQYFKRVTLLTFFSLCSAYFSSMYKQNKFDSYNIMNKHMCSSTSN